MTSQAETSAAPRNVIVVLLAFASGIHYIFHVAALMKSEEAGGESMEG